MLSNFVIFPHDVNLAPDESPTLPTLYAPFDIPTSPDYEAGGIIKKPLPFLGGLFARVESWALSFGFSLDSGFSGAVVLQLRAVRQSDALIGDESQLCQHQGWLGANTDDDLGDIAVRFGEAVYVDPMTSEITLMGREQFPFFMNILGDSSYSSITWGKGEGDNCPVVVTLPETGTDFITPSGFDGTGQTRFTLQVGGRSPLLGGGGGAYDAITGAGTMTPFRYWEYDPGDGDGPIYDYSTGDWLRDPRDPRFRILF